MISFISTLKVALNALRSNKMRSALTMLGVIIGVAAVIAMLAVGTGASRRIADQIQSIGSNILIILPGSTTSGGARMGAGTQPTLTLRDAEAIKKECPAVLYVAPILNGVAQVVYGHTNWSTSVLGSTQDLLDVRNWPLSSGRAFTDQDIRSATKVCLLGQTVVDNLFGAEDPVGQVVRIKNLPFKVVGVLAVKGQSAVGQDQDDTALIPVTTAQKRLFGTSFPGMVRTIMVEARSLEEMDAAQQQIEPLLRQRHHLGQKQDDDFTVRNLTQFMQAAEESSHVMTLLLGAIASVSLLVGGIGIMNIMLVTVTERTREIGTRKAIGAKNRDILLQFLVESIVMSGVGGTLGALMGIGLAKGIPLIPIFNRFLTIVEPAVVILAISVAAFVGIFFGLYPAYRASRLDPIEALRYE
ncbi:MAG TPA: ABC transporter permease [Terriglobales bacterium]|nr:ABC transporter permease [Terriglobales bacterium]